MISWVSLRTRYMLNYLDECEAKFNGQWPELYDLCRKCEMTYADHQGVKCKDEVTENYEG
jgi:hypothetical protein